MQIHARVTGTVDTFAALEAKGLLDLVTVGKSSPYADLCWPGPDTAEFLRRSAALVRFDLNPWMVCTQSEVEAAPFLRILCRKVAQDSERDFERSRAALDLQPWVGSDPNLRFRVPQRVYLSRLKLRPNEIAGVGEWSAEYVASGGVVSALVDRGLSGLRGLPVLHSKSDQPIEGYLQLHCESYLPERLIDIASPGTGSARRLDPSAQPTAQGWDCWGCLCYSGSSLDAGEDFNRTGEQMVSFEFPEWVVRRRVREAYTALALRGWSFEPVLQEGTELFAHHDELWRSLYRVLDECEVHSIRCEQPWRV
jgi:hypothetical protein